MGPFSTNQDSEQYPRGLFSTNQDSEQYSWGLFSTNQMKNSTEIGRVQALMREILKRKIVENIAEATDEHFRKVEIQDNLPMGVLEIPEGVPFHSATYGAL
jgi:hypothetical protein